MFKLNKMFAACKISLSCFICFILLCCFYFCVILCLLFFLTHIYFVNPIIVAPAELGAGYMLMDGGKTPRMTAPIPIRPKEPGYMDMMMAGQPLPTVKESGSKWLRYAYIEGLVQNSCNLLYS